jgi:serine/threonine protein kinase
MFELIKKRKKLTIPETQYFVYQLVDALCYLHNRQVIHREYITPHKASSWATC